MTYKFKLGSERGQSNGFIKGIMQCKSHPEILNWITGHDRQTIKDDMQYYADKYDLSLPEYRVLAKIIDKLKAMTGIQ